MIDFFRDTNPFGIYHVFQIFLNFWHFSADLRPFELFAIVLFQLIFFAPVKFPFPFPFPILINE